MGKANIKVVKDNQKAIHPRSRKAKQISKKVSRELKLKKRRGDSNIKLQCLGDKLAWFKENMDQEMDVITPGQVLELIQKYIDRNTEELEQITLKHSIGGRQVRQHASREDCLRITKERETELFTNSGFETVDFLTPDSLKIFKSWTGELRHLPNIKLRKYTKQGLEAMISGASETSEQCNPHQMEEDDLDAEEEDSGDEEMSE
ncbi:translation machinery-associated protein 16-like [Portunus trituberculatus]|uniref:Translation machinery-associated protein 16 n=1 Tax=Portunus trituberculatus TaxID=210409 RepID=A0A5B7D3G1_PORTR|nr:translation machinery-associated protein 16-like [Portunus trituberculatus]MPC14283.1 Translation machinery-associated protein 16 [Portunus trituberculatus]